jgi:VIT1/CCC1 family predicted Fe2+/Mn2+ transporter
MNGNSPRSVLDPLERASEIIFGLIMALTFTCTLSILSSENDVRTMLIGALGCNIAWGLVDGAMHVLAQVVTRERQHSLAAAVAAAPPNEARRLLLESLPDGAERLLELTDLDRVAADVRAAATPDRSVMPTWQDLHGAVAVFLLVFLSTFPVALPFLFFSDVVTALRTSNAVAVISLFVVGTGLGRYMHWPRPWAMGLAVALFGAILVAITIALGG